MTAIERGDIVSYAEGQYEVAEVQDDLLVLDGRAVLTSSGSGRCRERCTVLEADVVLVATQIRMEGA